MFSSPLAADLKGFLTFKRSLGVAYKRAEFMLREFDRFLASGSRRHKARYSALDSAVLAWLASKRDRKPVSVAQEVAVLRQFWRYLQRRGRAVGEPVWPRLSMRSTFVPSVPLPQMVKRLLGLTAGLRGSSLRRSTSVTRERSTRFRRRLYRTLLLVLYCTGVRFGEALRLRLRDIDLVSGTFFVAEFKGRARWVPFHPSLSRELRAYLKARRAIEGALDPSSHLFVHVTGQPLSVPTAAGTLRYLFQIAGLKPPVGRVGPRPYDFRHAFAVARLTRWYRAGVDLHARLPLLSAYLGHDDLLGTETYLHSTTELRAWASRRHRRRCLGHRRRRG
jgi:integrase/recombinase XerD